MKCIDTVPNSPNGPNSTNRQLYSCNKCNRTSVDYHDYNKPAKAIVYSSGLQHPHPHPQWTDRSILGCRTFVSASLAKA